MLLIGWWWMSASPLAKIRASGAPTTFEELLSEPIPDEQNVAAGLRDAFVAIESETGTTADLNDCLVNAPNAGDRLEEARLLVRSHADTLATIDAALQRPVYRSLLTAEALSDPRMSPLLDKATATRSVARLLSLATLVMADGDAGDAAKHALRQLRHAKAIEAEPTLTSRMMACAIQGMAIENANRLILARRLDENEAESLDIALAAIEDRSSLGKALQTERVFSMERLNQMPFFVRLTEQPGILRLYGNALAVADTPLEGLAAAGQRVTTEAGSLGALAAPAVQAVFEAEARVGLQARQLRQTLKAKQANR